MGFFGGSFSLPFASGSTPDAWVYPTEEVDNHCQQGIDRLIDEYKGKPIVEAILCAVLDQVQELEDMWQGLLRLDNLEDGQDDQLARDGRIVGADSRGGLSLEQYRLIVKATILVLKSDGTGPELLAILDTLFPNPMTHSWSLVEWFPAAFEATVTGVQDEVEAEVVYRLLYRAKDVGVRMNLIWNTSAPNGFEFSSTSSVETSSTKGFGDSSTPATGGLLSGVF